MMDGFLEIFYIYFFIIVECVNIIFKFLYNISFDNYNLVMFDAESHKITSIHSCIKRWIHFFLLVFFFQIYFLLNLIIFLILILDSVG